MSNRALPLLLSLIAVVTVALAVGLYAVTANPGGRAIADARAIAELAARTFAMAGEIPRAAEEAIGDQLVAQAILADQLVSATEAGRVDSVNGRLAAATASGNPTVLLVTDGAGKIVYRSRPAADVSFAADGTPPAYAKALAALVAGAAGPVVSPADWPEKKGPIYKQTAIRGARNRFVQVTADTSRLDSIARKVSFDRIIDDLLDAGTGQAVWLVATDGRVIASDARPHPTDAPTLDANERRVAETAVQGRSSLAERNGAIVVAAAPTTLADGTTAAVIVRRAASGGAGWPAALMVAIGEAVVLLGLAAVVILRWMRSNDTAFRLLGEAATNLGKGRFNPFTLSDLCERRDAAGKAGQAFRAMANDVGAREDGLEVKLLLAGETQAPSPD